MLVFLFTDLESSTRMWETYPDRMGPALAEHDAILRSAIEGHGGSLVKSTGDGLLATFTSAPACLHACIEAQQRLAATDWPTPEPLRVRMGAHAGDAEARAGDYFGTAVNRAARIMSAANGGQVVVSDIVVSLAADSDVELLELGRHRLKDLTDPAELFQVVVPGLQVDFPALATLAGTPNNLPVQVTEFVGREDVLAAASELLGRDAVRLVTLIGPGGTGKTRLSVQVAAEALESYPDGVYFVDLSDEHSVDGAFEAVVRELGLAGAREGTPLQVLRAKLREGRRLLVLDNLEQLTEIGPGISELLASCPGLDIVATSRELLRVRGEHAFPVPTLAVADPAATPEQIARSEATELFVERARAVRPDFALDAGNARAVADITADLDGLPLAIELAAARLQVFSPSELRDRLRDRVDVLGRGGRDVPTRQQTLRGAVEWSYELLDPDECRLFELLSVFPSAGLGPIEAVAGAVHPDLAVIDVLGSLVAKSLLRRVDEGGSRFSMLRVIREYARERLASDPELEGAVLAAHARHFTDWAVTTAAGAKPGTLPPALVVEIGNLQAAWRWWVAEQDPIELDRLFGVLWMVAESRGWYHMAIGLDTDLLAILGAGIGGDVLSELEIRTRLARSLMAVRGYTAEVQTHFERALASAGPGDARSRGRVLRALATYHMNTGEFDRSRALGEELVSLGTAEGDHAAVVEGHVVIGAMTFDLPAAVDHLDVAIEVWDRTGGGSRFRQGASPGVVARMASAIILTRIGRIDDAVRRADEGLAEARSIDHPFSVAYGLHHAAYFWVWLGRFDQTVRHAEELGDLARRHDYPVWHALGSIMEGVGRAGLGEGESALALSETGLELYRALSTPPVFWAPLQGVRALGFQRAGAPGSARPLLDEVVAMHGIEVVYPEFRVLHGDVLAELGEDESASESYRVAMLAARSAGARLVELAAMRRLVDHGLADRAELAELVADLDDLGESPELAAAATLLGG